MPLVMILSEEGNFGKYGPCCLENRMEPFTWLLYIVVLLFLPAELPCLLQANNWQLFQCQNAARNAPLRSALHYRKLAKKREKWDFL